MPYFFPVNTPNMSEKQFIEKVPLPLQHWLQPSNIRSLVKVSPVPFRNCQKKAPARSISTLSHSLYKNFHENTNVVPKELREKFETYSYVLFLFLLLSSSRTYPLPHPTPTKEKTILCLLPNMTLDLFM